MKALNAKLDTRLVTLNLLKQYLKKVASPNLKEKGTCLTYSHPLWALGHLQGYWTVGPPSPKLRETQYLLLASTSVTRPGVNQGVLYRLASQKRARVAGRKRNHMGTHCSFSPQEEHPIRAPHPENPVDERDTVNTQNKLKITCLPW